MFSEVNASFLFTFVHICLSVIFDLVACELAFVVNNKLV